jgi:hypothetical protein
MLEVMIESWVNPGVPTACRWSLWADGKRVAMGGPHGTAGESEAEALQYCARALKRKPDRVTRL